MVKKNWKWKQTDRQKEVFRELKERFTKELVLVAPDLDKKMRMEVDVSDYATGGVLSMECKNGKQQPVAFLSKSLNKIERNYEIYDKKMLVVIRGLENQRHLLKSTKFKFKVQIDHKNLEYFMKTQKLNRRQVRQALYLSRFDFTLKYVPEIKMGKVDKLSRKLDQKISMEKNNENQIFIKDYQIHNLLEVVIEEPEVNILEKIKIVRSKDEEVVRIVEKMKKVGVKVLRGEKQQIEGIWY